MLLTDWSDACEWLHANDVDQRRTQTLHFSGTFYWLAIHRINPSEFAGKAKKKRTSVHNRYTHYDAKCRCRELVAAVVRATSHRHIWNIPPECTSSSPFVDFGCVSVPNRGNRDRVIPLRADNRGCLEVVVSCRCRASSCFLASAPSLSCQCCQSVLIVCESCSCLPTHGIYAATGAGALYFAATPEATLCRFPNCCAYSLRLNSSVTLSAS